jgi:putative hydrolase of the HAD superfamily
MYSGTFFRDDLMIRTIFFDFGNVLGFFDHGRAIREFAKFTDMDPVELGLQLYGSPLEEDYESGKLTTAEYVRGAILNGRLRCSPEQFLSWFDQIFWVNPELAALVPRLKPRYQLVLASNTNDAHYRRYTEQFADTLRHFDHLIASHRIGARKPHAEFFSEAKRQAQAEPNECVFVDDLPVNVEAAIRAGFHGIVYTPGGSLESQLRHLGVLIS